jgi:1-acyl-sn-glycerol-3-phosphate acyltransferase
LLAILGVQLRVHGRCARDGRPVMLVANHVSWLDIVAINSVLPSRFVAKHEVRAWPLIGWLAAGTGTFFIQRARRRDAARVFQRLEQALRKGERVAVFPEATTTDGETVLAFRSSLLQAAVKADGALLPVGVRYLRADGSCCREATYCGGTTLWQSLLAVASQPGIRVELAFLPPLAARARSRRELAREAREIILRTLRLPAPGSRAGTRDHPPAAAR